MIKQTIVLLSQEEPYIIVLDAQEEYKRVYAILHGGFNCDGIETTMREEYYNLRFSPDTRNSAAMGALDSFNNRNVEFEGWINQERKRKYMELRLVYRILHSEPNPF